MSKRSRTQNKRENGMKPNPEPIEIKGGPPLLQIVITLHDNGQLTVTGPIQNKAMAYGLLELAKDAIRDAQAPQPDIIPVRLTPHNGGPLAS